MRRILLAAATALTLPLALATSAPAADAPPLTYSAHVAGIGWQRDVTSPATAGTTGQARAMEALRISGGTLTSSIDYRAHVAGIGWLGWVGPAYTAGTTGQARQLEAVQVRLTGQAATEYDVACRAHVANIGWLPWVTNGATCGTTGQARRMEAVQLRLIAKAAPSPSVSPSVTPSPTATAPAAPVRIAVTADTGMDTPTWAVMDAVGRSDARWVAILGDLAYRPAMESQYCDYVKARIGQPVALVPGNHEAQDGDGAFSRYAACLPDRVGVTGSYATGQWYLDDGPLRWISISPGITLPTGTRTYARGTPERDWLKDRIDEAKNAGRWVVVGMHMPCLTVGAHGCSSDPTITDMLLGKSVDLILSGHDHNYSRSHQISGTAAAPVVVDRDGTFAAGAGSVLVTVGAGGHNARTVASPLPAWAATASGTNSPGGIAFGHLEITATPTALTARYVADAGNTAYSDSFVVAR